MHGFLRPALQRFSFYPFPAAVPNHLKDGWSSTFLSERWSRLCAYDRTIVDACANVSKGFGVSKDSVMMGVIVHCIGYIVRSYGREHGQSLKR
jgi:hypothetical protein